MKHHSGSKDDPLSINTFESGKNPKPNIRIKHNGTDRNGQLI